MPRVTVRLGGKTLKLNTDYTVSYGANKNIGKGTVTIAGKGRYNGKKTVSFKIVPKKTTLAVKGKKGKKKSRSVKAKWKQAKAAQKVTGYVLQYRAAKSYRWKTKTFKAKAKSAVIKGLKKGKKYVFRMRVYKKVGGSKYSSAWSRPKKIRIS
jgi:ribosomal protein L14E/L6E/L27E